MGRDRSISFERRPSHRYPRRGKINSNRASGTLNFDISPQQQKIAHNMMGNNPESLLENTTIPEVHHRSNVSLNQREEQVILPNPNHHLLDSNHLSSNKPIDSLNRRDIIAESRDTGIVVDVHRAADEKGSLNENQTKTNMGNTQVSSKPNIQFDLHNQHQRNGDSVPHSAISKRTSSSSSGGYSATDEVDYLKWVSETKGQVRHHINKKISFATDRDMTERRDTNGSKSLNSSTSGVSSVESCHTDAIDLETKRDSVIKQYPDKAVLKRPSSSTSTSSGHGSPEDLAVADDIQNSDEKSYGSEKNNAKKESTSKLNTRSSPTSSISRVNSSSPDSGYEHLSSSGN